jgi:hypothetical protein
MPVSDCRTEASPVRYRFRPERQGVSGAAGGRRDGRVVERTVPWLWSGVPVGCDRVAGKPPHNRTRLRWMPIVT